MDEEEGQITQEDLNDEFLEVENLREYEFKASVYLQLAAERGRKILELEAEIEKLKKRIDELVEAYAVSMAFRSVI